jgi:hypothetical protein
MSSTQRWVERLEFSVTLDTQAAPETVYSLIADLSSHLEWSGTRLPANAERLLSLEAPGGVATAGTDFTSTGKTSIGTFHDRSRVTRAEPPSRFEFETESRLVRPGGTAMASRFEHRFLIERLPAGCRVKRTVRQAQFYKPAPWWIRLFAWPPVAATLYRWMAHAGTRTALRQLVAMAEERERAAAAGSFEASGAGRLHAED